MDDTLGRDQGDTVRLTAAEGHLRDRGVMTLLNSLSSPMLDARLVSEDPRFLFVAAILSQQVSFSATRRRRGRGPTRPSPRTEDRGPRSMLARAWMTP